jgi:hypothetical protein
MIKTNIKMRVTPEQSKKVQEICFANGIFWNATRAQVSHLEQKYLYIFDPYITFGETLNFFKEHSGEEVSAELFIRTQGTCEEKYKTEYLAKYVNHTNKDSMPKDYDDALKK